MKTLSVIFLLAACLVPEARGDWSFWPFNKDDKPGKPDKSHRLVERHGPDPNGPAAHPRIRRAADVLRRQEEEADQGRGTLVVYAFDETNRDANNARPDRKYVFTPEQLPLHYSKSKVGHSYSVWLPWDEVGGDAERKSRSSSASSRKEGPGGHQRPVPATASRPNRQAIGTVAGQRSDRSCCPGSRRRQLEQRDAGYADCPRGRAAGCLPGSGC